MKNLTIEEIEPFLEEFNLKITKVLDESVKAVIESTMIHPLEEEVSYEAYKKGIKSFKLEEFEAFYTKNISPNSLLMSLKLSNNQDKIVRTLKNESLEDSLYLKVLKLYDWMGEGIYDNDENRDVTLTFIKRFFKVDHFLDPATIYSPITFANIISDSKNPDLLDTVLSLPNYEFKVSKSEFKRAKNIRELVANNPHANEQTLKRLLNLMSEDIDYFLAQNPSITPQMQKDIFQRAKKENLTMLSINENLSDEIFEKLLKDDEIAPTLLAFAKIDRKRYSLAKNEPHFFNIAQNETIEEFIDDLIDINDEKIDFLLASNPITPTTTLKLLYDRHKEKIASPISSNPNLSNELIQKLYLLQQKEVDLNLAQNRSTPKEILEEYFKRQDHDLNLSLALNSSTPLALLQQLQLDNRMMNNLSKNETFTKNILNGLGI